MEGPDARPGQPRDVLGLQPTAGQSGATGELVGVGPGDEVIEPVADPAGGAGGETMAGHFSSFGPRRQPGPWPGTTMTRSD